MATKQAQALPGHAAVQVPRVGVLLLASRKVAGEDHGRLTAAPLRNRQGAEHRGHRAVFGTQDGLAYEPPRPATYPLSPRRPARGAALPSASASSGGSDVTQERPQRAASSPCAFRCPNQRSAAAFKYCDCCLASRTTTPSGMSFSTACRPLARRLASESAPVKVAERFHEGGVRTRPKAIARARRGGGAPIFGGRRSLRASALVRVCVELAAPALAGCAASGATRRAGPRSPGAPRRCRRRRGAPRRRVRPA